MITKSKAVELVTERINAGYSVPGDRLTVVEGDTIEREYGWVFFYNSQKYLETGEFRYMLAGNAPIVVEREDGSMHPLGTARPIEESLKQYEGERRVASPR